jgi:hypothetical protein
MPRPLQGGLLRVFQSVPRLKSDEFMRSFAPPVRISLEAVVENAVAV